MDFYSSENNTETSVATTSHEIDESYEAINSPLSRITTSLATLDPDIALDNFNSIEYLIKTLEAALNSLQFDKALVLQSQMAGQINNTSHEVLNTIEELQNCLIEHTNKYNKLKFDIIPEIEKNIKQSSKHVKNLTKYMKINYPVEYSKGRDKVLNRITDENEDTDLFQ